MFRIGEFSKIAQIPASQLNYYDRIGLFQPDHTDKENGYRLYSIAQLPDLNRILALKELGLTLEQIRRMVQDNVSADEMRGMLALRKAQTEQAVQDELNRLRVIEARLREVEKQGRMLHDDVVLKSIPTQPFFATRNLLANAQLEGRPLMQELMQHVPRQIGRKRVNHLAAIIHGDGFRFEQADIEMGFLLNDVVDRTLLLPSGKEVNMRLLPAEEQVVSAVRFGPFENGFDSYAQLGHWIVANGYQITGPAREIFFEPPLPNSNKTAVAEIQFPVRDKRPLIPT